MEALQEFIKTYGGEVESDIDDIILGGSEEGGFDFSTHGGSRYGVFDLDIEYLDTDEPEIQASAYRDEYTTFNRTKGGGSPSRTKSANGVNNISADSLFESVSDDPPVDKSDERESVPDDPRVDKSDEHPIIEFEPLESEYIEGGRKEDSLEAINIMSELMESVEEPEPQLAIIIPRSVSSSKKDKSKFKEDLLKVIDNIFLIKSKS